MVFGKTLHTGGYPPWCLVKHYIQVGIPHGVWCLVFGKTLHTGGYPPWCLVKHYIQVGIPHGVW